MSILGILSFTFYFSRNSTEARRVFQTSRRWPLLLQGSVNAVKRMGNVVKRSTKICTPHKSRTLVLLIAMAFLRFTRKLMRLECVTVGYSCDMHVIMQDQTFIISRIRVANICSLMLLNNIIYLQLCLGCGSCRNLLENSRTCEDSIPTSIFFISIV